VAQHYPVYHAQLRLMATVAQALEVSDGDNRSGKLIRLVVKLSRHLGSLLHLEKSHIKLSMLEECLLDSPKIEAILSAFPDFGLILYSLPVPGRTTFYPPKLEGEEMAH
jgi:hypothetical protein